MAEGGKGLVERIVPARRAAQPPERHAGDALRVVVGAAIVAGTSVVVYVRPLRRFEQNLFHLVNELPSGVTVPLYLLMQVGTIGASYVAAALALAARRPRLARELAACGTISYLAAKYLKAVIDRERPFLLLEAALVRGGEASGLGFPSGHSALAATLATAADPYLSRPASRVAWAWVWMTALARIYVGAHMPDDVIGGAALGWTVGSGWHLLLGAPGVTADVQELEEVLAARGLAPVALYPIPGDVRGGAAYWLKGEGEQFYLVRVITPVQRAASWLRRLWRYATLQDVRGDAPALTPKQQVEHEAYLMLLAARAGVHVPRFVLEAEVGAGAALLVEERVEGEEWGALPASALSEGRVAALWQQVAWLREERLAHGHLHGGTLLLDGRGETWLTGWARGVAAASDAQLARDVAQVLALLAPKIGVGRAVASAEAALGRGALRGVAATLFGRMLPLPTQRALADDPALLGRLREAVATRVEASGKGGVARERGPFFK